MSRALSFLSRMILSSFVFVLIGGTVWMGWDIVIESWHVFGWKMLIAPAVYAAILWSAWYHVERG